MSFRTQLVSISSKCFLSIIAGIASFWGLVKSGNLSLNQFLTGGDSIASKPSVSCGLSRYSIFTILFHYPSGPQWTQQLLQNFVNTSKRIFHDFIKKIIHQKMKNIRRQVTALHIIPFVKRLKNKSSRTSGILNIRLPILNDRFEFLITLPICFFHSRS